MTVAWVGLGSNRGDRFGALARAAVALAALPRTRLETLSSVYETEPVGFPGQESYLNAVARLSTDLEPEPLLDALLAIERDAGREAGARFGPRTLDLDLLAWGDRVQSTARLTLPHPRLATRPFVLVPLAEIAPGWRHPALHLTVETLLRGFGFTRGVRPAGRLPAPEPVPAAAEEAPRS